MLNQKKVILSLILIMLVPVQVCASELWMQQEIDASSSFITSVEEELYTIELPTSDGVLYSQSKKRYLNRDGWLGFGFQKSKTFELEYSKTFGQLAYYFLNEVDLPEKMKDINFTSTTYKREDFLVDLFYTHENWDLNAGYMFTMASNLFHFQGYDGMARNSETAILGYDYRSYCKFWQASRHDAGFGSGYYFALSYHPTDNLTFNFLGDDLASRLVWQGVDEYQGIIDLDFIRTNLKGEEYVKSPLRGDYFNKDSMIIIPVSPKWRGSVQFQRGGYQIESWAYHYKVWEIGVKGTIQHHSNLRSSAGLMARNSNLVYTLGLKTDHFQVDLMFDSLQREKLTNVALNCQVYLF